ncbi:MAG: ATP-binding cassette domain-containing protein [Calditrichaeota bacterium]|nr:MAG: ATP-binding cassette domain-containing protein [Calditrichota bacterium]
MQPIISVKNLTKSYKVFKRREGVKGSFLDLFKRDYYFVEAVKNVSFEIEKGETIGYIGTNGAGKSTTIKMLTGILHPTEGEINILGRVPHKERTTHVQNIGVVFGQRTQLWWDIAVVEAFNLLQKIYRVDEKSYKNRIDNFSEILGIGELLNIPVRKLSLGQRMKCDLVASLIHNPKILFLDEPTIGLDVSVKFKLREFLKELNSTEKTTIFLTTHDLVDIEEICKRIIIIDKGHKIYDGTLSEIHKNFGGQRKLVLDFREKPEKNHLLNFVKKFQAKLEDSHTIIFSQNVTSASELISVFLQEFKISDLKLKEMDLTEIVKNIYEKEK